MSKQLTINRQERLTINNLPLTRNTHQSNVKGQLSNVLQGQRSNVPKGFTLLEVLLSVAAIAIIAVISIPFYQSFQVRNDLDIAANTWVQTLRRAQTLAQAVDGDTTWGVKVQSASLTLFKGASYAARDTNFDEVFNVPTSITPSGITEIVFTKFTGLPQTTGTTTLTASTAETRNIIINQKGMVNY